MIPIQWATGSSKGRSENANGSRLVNLFAEQLPPDSKSPVVLYGTPGESVFTNVNQLTVFGTMVMDNQLYAVTDTKLYSVDEFGVITELGDVIISDRVSWDTNGTSLVFVDGTKGYYYSIAGGLVEFAGGGWFPARTVTYQDGYFIFQREGTGQFFISEILSTTLDPLDFATAEAAPDDTIAVLSDHRELWLFGEHSVEVWYNSGDPDFTFERMQGAYIERGCAAAMTVTKMDNSVFWLAEDGVVYRALGYQPQRISTHAVEFDIADYRWEDAFAYTYTEEGHKFFVLTFPTSDKTWCFDVATGLWHERSYGDIGRHNSNCYARCYNKHLVGDFQTGNIYELDMDVGTDNGEEIKRLAVAPPIHAARDEITCYSFEVDMESGVGLVTGQGSDPQAMLQWSDDGGKTWSNEHWTGIGKIGEYTKRVKWNRLGQFRQRQFKLAISDPVPVVILGAFAEVQRARG